jgi:hypothetical protein
MGDRTGLSLQFLLLYRINFAQFMTFIWPPQYVLLIRIDAYLFTPSISNGWPGPQPTTKNIIAATTSKMMIIFTMSPS